MHPWFVCKRVWMLCVGICAVVLWYGSTSGPRQLSLGGTSADDSEMRKQFRVVGGSAEINLGQKIVSPRRLTRSQQEIRQRFQHRLNTLSLACRRHEHSTLFRPFISNIFTIFAKPPLFNYTLNFCPIPKVGYKNWWDILSFLRQTVPQGNVTSRTRSYTGQGQVNVFFTREPYSRLFSAYVDKFLKPTEYEELGGYIVNAFRRDPSAAFVRFASDVTFAEFVKYVLSSEETGERRDFHFVPVHNQCSICLIEYDYIGHYETFAEDTAYILNVTQAPYVMPDDFKDGYDMFSLRQDLELLMEKSDIHSMTMDDALRRLWKTWQIRGIISKTEHFPMIPRETDNVTTDVMTRVARAALERSGPKAERRLQKEEAIREAYSSVPLVDRERLQELFTLDFDLFGFEQRRPDFVFPPKPYVRRGTFSYFAV